MNGRMADRLRETLEEDIVTGRLMPGGRLDEVSLANRFHVSRTPIRETLHQLAAAGLVELRPRRGAIVAATSMERLVQMFETMAEMEATCGRLAARRMSDAERGSLRDIHAACGQACKTGDPEFYYEQNARFHDAIYRGTHNDFLIEEARRLHRRLQPYRRLQLRVRDRLTNSFAEHCAIMTAILAGNDEAAEEALRTHVMIQGERFTDLLAQLNARQQASQRPS